ncbi:ribose-phosphate pyrophosphokinase [Mycoplasma hyorhinis]|uniref:ribose-phosphate pyrophosphokinase n=1 Tax=Mesomycoplasma hyorhinis TaxID=2100 RepID=UPI00136D4E4E|nr:ribose-phosphate pyrophosphokinase [Mesomycoplasma hyorhinis]MXR08697.1 ribose-phosphate pyrophosphokinase [Mesomycoplasma hyorhinis]
MIVENKKNVVLFGMPNCQNLANKISEILKIPLTPIEKTQFADGEVLLKSVETIRNSTVFVVASTHKPVHDNIMELLIFMDSLKRAYARDIIVILSYFGYARQDRKSTGRQPITAKLIANLLETAGATKIISVDLHNPSIQGFFNISVDELRGQYILAKKIKEKNKSYTIVSPDHGGAVRARLLAELLNENTKIAIIDKRRIGTNQVEAQGIIGDIEAKDTIIIDDIIDTGGTIIKAADMLKKNGAKSVTVVATHGIFSKGFELFQESKNVDKVIITNSIDNSELEAKYSKLEVACLSEFIADTIKACIFSTSISSIYSQLKENFKK